MLELFDSITRYTWTTEYYHDTEDSSYCVIRFTHTVTGEVYDSFIDADMYPLCRSLPLYPALTRGVYIMYSIRDIDGKLYNKYLHKTILSAEGLHTDHIDMNPLNNRRSNLRLVTCSQNLRNASMQSNNSLGRKGLAVKRDEFGNIKCVRACYSDDTGQHERSFHVSKYGMEEALRLANEVLDEMQAKNNITVSYQSRKDRLGY